MECREEKVEMQSEANNVGRGNNVGHVRGFGLYFKGNRKLQERIISR